MTRFKLPKITEAQKAQLTDAHDAMVNVLVNQLQTGRRKTGRFMPRKELIGTTEPTEKDDA